MKQNEEDDKSYVGDDIEKLTKMDDGINDDNSLTEQ